MAKKLKPRKPIRFYMFPSTKKKTDLDSLILRFPHSSGQVCKGLLTLAELGVYNETLKHKYIRVGLDFIMDVLDGCNSRVNSDVLGTFHPKIAVWKKRIPCLQ